MFPQAPVGPHLLMPVEPCRRPAGQGATSVGRQEDGALTLAYLALQLFKAGCRQQSHAQGGLLTCGSERSCADSTAAFSAWPIAARM